MSSGEEKDGPATGAKPGAHTQFKKGQSGNPKGRPRKESVGPLTIEMAQLVISETERLLTLTEGGRPVTMPALQAVLRSTIVSGAKGNPHAQRTVMQLASTAQAQMAKAKQDECEGAILLKIHLDHERDVWVAKGRAEADMPRHPSDIEIDRATGAVKSFLIFTQEDLATRQQAINMRDFLIEETARLLRVAEIDGDDPLLQIRRESAKAMIDGLNAMLPPRFRRYLIGDPNCPATGASPEEIWKLMGRDLASFLQIKAADRVLDRLRMHEASERRPIG